MINLFWWGTNCGSGRGIRWLSWQKLTIRKAFGGTRFRHFHGFNMAMLGKQAKKFIFNPNTMVSRMLTAKYFQGRGSWKPVLDITQAMSSAISILPR